jgi:peptide/nickel transport system substrate-binding protein
MHKRLLGLLATSVIVFAACGTGTASNGPGDTGVATAPPATPTPETVDLTSSKYAPEAGTKGGQLLFGDWQEANQFNPYYLTQVTEANVASAAWASFVVTTNDYKYLPDLAKEIPTTQNGGVVLPGVNGDKMTVTWTLKDGLKWSDGQALTCDDFAYTLSWVKDPGQAGVSTVGYDDVTSIDCPSPTQVVYHFKNVYEGYINLGTPLPKHYLSSISIADQLKGAGFRPADMPKVPVSGAFKFESVTSQQELRMVRNDNYNGFKSGKPANLDTLIFKWYGSEDAEIAGYAAGEVDIATDLVEADIPTFDSNGHKAELSNIPSLTYEYLALNWADGKHIDPTTKVGHCSPAATVADRKAGAAPGTACPISDPQFRLALTYAINKDDIIQRALGGLVKVANTNVAPDAYYFLDQPPATFDPAKAGQILDAAGWKAGADGIRVNADGLRAKIELCSTTKASRIESLKLMVEELKAVGIEAIAANGSPTDVFNDFNSATPETPCNIYRGNFDVAEFASSVSIDPIGNYQSYHSSQFEPKGANLAGVSDPQIDAALDAVKNTVDFVAVRHAMETFQKVYVEKTVEIPLFFRGQLDAVSPKVGNFAANPTSAGPTWNAVDWYLKS